MKLSVMKPDGGNAFANWNDSKHQKSFIFDSIMLLSNEKPNNYTQYSGSRKGSDLKSNNSNRDSKQGAVDFNSYNNDDDLMISGAGGDADNILNLVTESEVSASENEELYQPKEHFNLLLDSTVKNKGKKKHNSGYNVQGAGSSASVMYNIKGSSSDVLQNPSMLSGMISGSRRTTSHNR